MAEEIDRWNPEPVYLQLAAILRGQIKRGELVPRQPLPSESYLTGAYGVSRGTARRAVQVLLATLVPALTDLLYKTSACLSPSQDARAAGILAISSPFEGQPGDCFC